MNITKYDKLILTAIILILSFQYIQARDISGRESVGLISMIQVLANPDSYHNKEIVMLGVLNVEFEKDVLYMSEDDAEHDIITNSISLEYTSEYINRKDIKNCDGEYVMVVGKFRKHDRNNSDITTGSQGVTVGTIFDISEIYSEYSWRNIPNKKDCLSVEQ